MTTQVPAQCFACTRRAPDVDEHGTPAARTCTAFPAGIPSPIAAHGADHRTPFGGEVDGLLFHQVESPAGADAFSWWQRVFAPAPVDQPPPVVVAAQVVGEPDDPHAGCTTEYCRNPLHPGPCKGWKDLLRQVAPGVPSLIRDRSRGPSQPRVAAPNRPRIPWTPIGPAPATPAAPAKATKAAAKKAAKAAKAATPRAPRVPRAPQPAPARALPAGFSSQDLHDFAAGNPAAGRMEQAMKSAYDLTDPATGLTTKVVHVQRVFGGPPGAVRCTIEIQDRDGNRVGSSTRTWHFDGRGSLVVHHDYLSLDRSVQGGGFAQRYNDQAMGIYQQAGVKRVELLADIDVGGYAWAKQGFDFARASGSHTAATRLRGQLRRLESQRSQLGIDAAARAANAPEIARLQAVIDAGHALIQRADTTRHGTAAHPTALEFAMLGWTPGATTWPGKAAMLGSFWDAVKKVPPVAPPPRKAAKKAAAVAAAAVPDDPPGAAPPQVQAILDGADELHRGWTAQVADQVPVNPEDMHPNRDGETDYNEHHHDMSATAEQQDPFNAALLALLYGPDDGGDR